MKAYHFTSSTLRNGKPIPPIGEWLIHPEMIIPCQSGLHASPTPFDALKYAPGFLLHKVELGGTIFTQGNPVDKFVAEKRKIISTIDTTEICLNFACDCALDVSSFWNPPEIVLSYLRTRDKSIANAAAANAAAAAAYAAYANAAAADAAYAAYAAYAAAAYANANANAAAAAAAADAAYAAYANAAADIITEQDKLKEYKNKFNQIIYDNFTKA